VDAPQARRDGFAHVTSIPQAVVRWI